MRLFGLQITKAAPAASTSSVPSNRWGWWPIIRERFAGAWQRNLEWKLDSVLAHHAVFTCITLISNDIAKLRPKLVEQDQNGIWKETESAAFSPVLRKPNPYQNRIQFIAWWIISKLTRGNTYVLKVRDDRRVVRRLYILDPALVTVLVSDDGGVYYRLNTDNLSGLTEAVTVPASEVIHDRMNCLFHPLVGLSPIFASGLAANVGLKLEANAADFFANGSNPGGVLTAPGKIDGETAKRIKDHWETEYSGENSGKVAVLGDGLTFAAMRMTAVDAQMIEHLKWSAETIASTFHVPAFKAGIGTMPTYQNGETLNGIYYSDCLQSLIEELELCLDEGLGLGEPKDGRQMGVELDLDALLRMDQATQVKTLAEGVKGSIYTPNEARRKMDLPPLLGGETVYMQQQNYSLAALDARDRAAPAPSTSPDPKPTDPGAPTEKVLGSSEPAFWQKSVAEHRPDTYSAQRTA